MAEKIPLARKKWDPIQRRQTANDILDGKIGVRDVIRIHKVQPYQLYAWIGQAAVARLENAPPRRQERTHSELMPLPKGGKFSADEVLAFAEWYQQRRAVRGE